MATRQFVRTAQQALEQQRRDHEPGGFAHRAKATAAALPPVRKEHTVRKSDFWPSKYLKAEDFNEPVTLTIERVARETLENGGRKDVKPVVYFAGEKKGLICNLTNFDMLVDIAGDGDTDAWPGTKVELFASTVMVGSEVKPCVRVRAPAKPATAKAAAKTKPPAAADLDDEIPEQFR